ncbi:hypothetical protein HMPREF0519_2244 [Lentilactobacillus hilgardii DSM 20176 = ATCC 8290]|uniref:Uncharacterized protein n=1 Tax=Lentilactobacillus hilgardii (strain ATCC 8290 / DSM 20176 / CCUG 30140 / JCM 1155 / KCTC 3500 / NBRC 15886 / NCIMB 8040 / NRRL B-1843 / 9) TaxID=1423757 RepID=C0XLY3_LENH9|nr:hypothetical protein HMPREF0519_2244 [Lentilactobacillus hilgardii DSM 20176 = ATCC 8290]
MTDDPIFGTQNENAVMSLRSFTEAVLQKNARFYLTDYLNEDR